ncbi:hypothetical protein KBD61_05000 [Patescibacteria group bacterium]|nr:hypothetical protein [Patescibacteria group bacterium]MBP9710348.1 hypothetical protein [Patescibacteria group bacterium]
MNETPSASNSNGVLIALVVVSLIISLGALGLVVQGQSQARDAQRELVNALVMARTTSPTPSPMPVGQAPQVPAPVNVMAPVAEPVRPAAPTPQAEEWATMTYDGVTISYPKNLSATTYEDEFASGQRNLRVSSSASRRVGIDSRGFQGYELVMRRIDDRQYADSRKENTVNPRVSSIVEMCDGETCPDAQYIFIKDGKRYLIEVLYKMTPYQAGIDLNNKVIASIK